jgi:heptosyltransferase-1
MTASHSTNRVLIIRPSALGDVCRTVPVLASIRRSMPDARIDWLVRDVFVDAIAAHPALDDVLPFPRARFARWWRDGASIREIVRWLGDLRRGRYDLVIDCQGLGRSGLMALATGAPHRIGPRSARELAWLGYTVRVPLNGSMHTVDRMLALLPEAGIQPVPDMRLYAPERDVLAWSTEREALGVEGRYAVLAPTARWSSKRWPVDRWRALLEPLRERGFEHIVVIAAPDEVEQTAGLADELDPDSESIVDLSGRTTIGRTMAVLAGAGLVVANDSAPLHIAVGFDRPCVGLFGPTDPALVGPYQRPEAVVSALPDGSSPPVNYRDRRLGDDLMRRISVEQVLTRIDAVLGSPRCGVGDDRSRVSFAEESR